MRCDSHVHIVGPPDRYPQVSTRTYLAGVATLDELRRRGAERGVTRFVIVQPSFYGTDNSVLLESLETLGADGRGVAVVDPAMALPETLADLANRGVRGLRFNLYSTPAGRVAQRVDVAFAALARLAQAIEGHVEVIAPIKVLVDNAEVFAQSPAPVVIDHYGVYGRSTPESAEGRGLLDLIRRPHVWIKLSAPYRVSDDPLATRPDQAWLAALVAAAPDRCVWGSDWPHTPPHEAHKGADIALPFRELSYATVVDHFLAALPSAELADRIMRDNPARLYGF